MKLRQLLLIYFSLLLFVQQAWSNTTSYTKLLSKANIVQGKTITLTDPNAGTNTPFYGKRRALVRLVYGRETQSDGAITGNGWSFGVGFKARQADNATVLMSESENNFKVIYSNSGSVYEALRVIELPNTGTAGVAITLETPTSATAPNDIRLEVELEVESYTPLVGAPNNTNHVFSKVIEEAEHKAKVYWDYLPGAESYELEWVYLDDLDKYNRDLYNTQKKITTTPPTPNTSFTEDIFARAVRVETSDLSFDISTTYPSGYIVYRVRGVGRHTEGVNGDYSHYNYGDWSSSCNAIIELKGFSPLEIWNTVTTYAEEGKYKKVVGYFDNHLRKRETLTNLSTEGVTLAGSSFYDREGRPSINILPSPVIKSNKFDNTLFKTSQFGGYTANLFDRYEGAESLETITENGSGTYFSTKFTGPTLSNLNILYKNYIPDAGGHPMTQTRYLNDGTGRVASQTGVGVEYNLNSKKETEYFYATPTEIELRRLFGNNVGDAKYYKKNIVKDANGQLSVSYIDMAGRVIATALMGDSPSNVEKLDSDGSKSPVTASLNAENIVDKVNGISKTSHKFFNPTTGDKISLKYDIKDLVHQMTDAPCLGCEYELTIKLIAPNIPTKPKTADKILLTEFFNGSLLAQNCSLIPNNSISGIGQKRSINDEILNEIGTYTIEKILKVIKPSVDKIKENLIASDKWKGILTDLKVLYEARIDKKQCARSCEEWALYEVEDQSKKASTPFTDAEKLAKIKAIIKECEQTALNAYDGLYGAECENLRQQMLDQMMPGGCIFKDPDLNRWDNLLPTTVATLDKTNSNKTPRELRTYLERITKNGERDQSVEAILIERHPESCQLKKCDDYKDVNQFARKLAITRLSDLGSSNDLGLTTTVDVNNPGQLNSWIVNTLIKADPVVKYNTIKAKFSNDFETALTTYLLRSTWGTNEGCPPPNNNIDGVGSKTFYELIQLCDMRPSVVLTAVDKEVKWSKIKSLFLGAREFVLNRRYSNNPGCNIAKNNCTIVPNNDDFYGILKEDGTIDEGKKTTWINNNKNKGDGDIWADALNQDKGGIYDAIRCSQQFENRKTSYLAQLKRAFPDKDFTSISCGLIAALDAYKNTACNANNPYAFILTDVGSPSYDAIQAAIDCALQGSGKQWNVAAQWGVKWGDVYESNQTCVLSDCGEALNNLISTISLAPYGSAINCNNKTYIVKKKYSLTGSTDDGDLIAGSEIPYNYSGSLTHVFLVYDPVVTLPSIFIYQTTGVHTFQGDPITVSGPPGNINNCEVRMRGILVTPDHQENDFVMTTVKTKTYLKSQTTQTETEETLYNNCIKQQRLRLETLAEIEWNKQVNDEVARILNEMEVRCWKIEENFEISRMDKEHHYTLYYYDQAGSLVQTIPPAGVERLDYNDQTYFKDGKWIYNKTDMLVPYHRLKTNYQYNSLGQVEWQKTPDGGISKFKYDYAQRLRFSQNAQQAGSNFNKFDTEGAFSYTKYDDLGRVIEVGKATNSVEGQVYKLFTEESFAVTNANTLSYPFNSPGENYFSLTEITSTQYNGLANSGGINQNNTRNRVSSVKIRNKGSASDDIITYYDYDIHGNVKTLYHKVAVMNDRIFKTEYKYDLISNKVNEIAYQKGSVDQYFHRYRYDADNRLTSVFTSQDSYIWERDARYFYYLHGPMARMELGEDKVQGQDYIYTMQGWIKAVNLPGSNSHTFEPGKDGNTEGVNRFMARDEMSYVLGYNNSDYKPISANIDMGLAFKNLMDPTNGVMSQVKGNGFFNGNIAAMMTDIKQMARMLPAAGQPQQAALMASAYKYDALHRILQSKDFIFSGSNKWVDAAGLNNNTNYSYDANGNLLTLQRYNQNRLMDNLTYAYNRKNIENSTVECSTDATKKITNNQLCQVTDAQADIVEGSSTIDELRTGNHTFDYDAIGNIIRKKKNGVTEQTIEWNVYGKISKVTRASDSKVINYTYDAMGNRLAKTFDGKTTIYVRDASGNVMAAYEQKLVVKNGVSTIRNYEIEVPLYGSSRLGQKRFTPLNDNIGAGGNEMVDVTMRPLDRTDAQTSALTMLATRGNKFFELSNHLGNVLSVITDQKTWKTEGTESYYVSIVVSATDYYPFGLAIQGRKFDTNKYRYGFNSKENDADWGTEVIQDYGFRIYSPAIAKFISIDPLSASYPWYTPYQFAGNMPITCIDIDGAEPGFSIRDMNEYTRQAEIALNGKEEGERQYQIYRSGQTYGAAIGSAAALDIVLTKGRATTWLMAVNAFSNQHVADNHRRLGDEAKARVYEKRASENACGVLVGCGLGQLFKYTIKYGGVLLNEVTIAAKAIRKSNLVSKSGKTAYNPEQFSEYIDDATNLPNAGRLKEISLGTFSEQGFGVEDVNLLGRFHTTIEEKSLIAVVEFIENVPNTKGGFEKLAKAVEQVAKESQFDDVILRFMNVDKVKVHPKSGLTTYQKYMQDAKLNGYEPFDVSDKANKAMGNATIEWRKIK
jgi:RHS repeat-associated protein